MQVPRISRIRDLPVFGVKGKYLGQVTEVLFDVKKPMAVGVQVQRDYMLGLIQPRARYVLLTDVKLVKPEGMLLSIPKLPGGDRGEKALGFSWDKSVIWRKMPVRSATGDPVGVVKDVLYSAETGTVKKLFVSTGMVGDAAVGRLEVPGDLVNGFRDDAVIIKPEYKDLEAAGGAAKAMATGVTALKTRGGQVADGFGEVGVTAAGAIGRSFRTGLGRKAINKVKSLMGEDK